MARFFLYAAAVLVIGTLALGIGLYLGPKEKAAELRALAQHGLDVIAGVHPSEPAAQLGPEAPEKQATTPAQPDAGKAPPAPDAAAEPSNLPTEKPAATAAAENDAPKPSTPAEPSKSSKKKTKAKGHKSRSED